MEENKDHILFDQSEDNSRLFKKVFYYQILVFLRSSGHATSRIMWEPMIIKLKIYNLINLNKISDNIFKESCINCLYKFLNDDKNKALKDMLVTPFKIDSKEQIKMMTKYELKSLFDLFFEKYVLLRLPKFCKFVFSFLLHRVSSRVVSFFGIYKNLKINKLRPFQLCNYFSTLSNFIILFQLFYAKALQNNFIDLSKSFLLLYVNIYFIFQQKPVTNLQLKKIRKILETHKLISAEKPKDNNKLTFFEEIFYSNYLPFIYDHNITFYFYFLYKKLFCSKSKNI